MRVRGKFQRMLRARAYQSTTAEETDAFPVKFNQAEYDSGQHILAAGSDYGYGAKTMGNVYLTGCTSSSVIATPEPRSPRWMEWWMPTWRSSRLQEICIVVYLFGGMITIIRHKNGDWSAWQMHTHGFSEHEYCRSPDRIKVLQRTNGRVLCQAWCQRQCYVVDIRRIWFWLRDGCCFRRFGQTWWSMEPLPVLFGHASGDFLYLSPITDAFIPNAVESDNGQNTL